MAPDLERRGRRARARVWCASEGGGGGGGAGVTVSPVCFLIITKDGSASILGINAQADSTVDRLVEMIPGAINRVSSFVEGFSGKKKAPADESAPMEGGEE